MIRLLSFILLFNVVVFAQLYERKNIEIIRGNDRILLFTYKGDLSNDTLLFGVKPTKELSSNRVISKISTDITEININYFNGVSTIEIDLEAYETVDLDSARYWYDLTRYHNSDTTTLYLGWFDVWASVTSPFDGTNLPKDGHRFFVAGTFVDSTTVDSSLFMWDEDTQSIITVPYQQYVGTILPDSIIYPNDTTALRTYSDLKYMPIDTTIGLDTVAVNDLIDEKLDSVSAASAYTIEQIDSLLNLAGTAPQKGSAETITGVWDFNTINVNTLNYTMADTSTIRVYKIVSQSSNYTISNSKDVVLMTSGTTSKTVTLPITGISDGRIFVIKKIDSGAGSVIITVEGGGNIDGQSSLTIYYQYTSYSLMKSGSNYIIL